MATPEQKQQQLENILASDTFRGKELYQNLLRYLVTAALDGFTPKEVTVAQEVFNKGSDFNSAEDASVRVHMHNLRNKLDRYYQHDGKNDAFTLYIPKGHYKVEFRKNETISAPILRDRKNVLISILSVLLVLLCLSVVLDRLFLTRPFEYSDLTTANNHFWPHFFQNDYPAHIVIGDFLIFHEYHEELERNRRIMDYELYTAEALESYIRNHPDVYPTPWNLGELPHNAIFNILDLQPVFQAFRQKVQMAFTTEIDIDFIKNRNLIYIGEFKNLRALADLVTALPVQIETLPWWHGRVSFQKQDTLITLSTSRDWEKNRYVTDLGILAMIPGQTDENYLICAGFGYNAQIKIIELISHRESLQRLEEHMKQQHGAIPDYFVVVYKVKGFDRASTTAELMFFSAIDKSAYLANLIPTE